MRRKNGKRFAAAAVSGLLAAAVLITAVLSGKIEAEAAETFLGIEELRNEVTKSGREYTILEIVPDRNGAEIGFLTDGYEPVLSTWNEEKQQWESWKEKLCSLATFEERKAYIEGLKVELQAYYDAKGIAGDKPVSIAKDAYEESDTKEDGFTAITAAAVEKTGWFVKAAGADAETYQLKFRYMGQKENYDEESDWVYYKILGEPKAINALSEEEIQNLAEDTVIYKKENGEGVFSVKALWGELNADESETETESASEPESEQETEKETQTESAGETETGSETETESASESATESSEKSQSETEPESSAPESSQPESTVPESSEEESTVPESSQEEDVVPENNETKSSETESTVAGKQGQMSLKSAVITEDNADTKKESEELQTTEEQQTQEQAESDVEEMQQTQEQAESDTEEMQQTQEQSAGTSAETADIQGTYSVEGQTEEAEEYYLVSFEKIEDVSALAETDTIYIVEQSGVIRSANGEYSFVESTDEAVRKQTYAFGGITIYCKNTFTNHEWFKKNVLDMEEEEYEKFKIQVLTFTPAELNAMSELPAFDFLYLNSGARVINSEIEMVSYGKDTMDLDESAAQRLFQWIIANGTPCLVDGGIMYEKDAQTGSVDTIGAMKETKIFGLTALLCQKSLSSYSQSVGSLGELPLDDLLEAIEDSDKNFTTEQTYCRLGTDSIINSSFAKATKHAGNGEVEEGFQGVLDEINLENLYRESDTGMDYKLLSTDISEARVLRHIINYKNRRITESKKHIKVLEIQPALTKERELTPEKIKEWAPDVESVDTTIMTTAEFIGKIEKLNENYDLIYIGTSKEHLNIKRWVEDNTLTSYKTDPYLGSTVFNDHDMDGLIYYNIGDLRVVYLAMAGLLDTEYPNGNRDDWPYYYNYVRYGGNDITKEKMEALLSFLDGSYPIIVSDEFMEQPATFFEATGFTGRRGTLEVGKYDTNALREKQIYADESGNTKAEKISSLKVKEGYRVTLYSGNDSVTFEKDVEDLSKVSMADGTNTWDNRCEAVLIEKIETAQPVKAVDEDKIDNCTYLYEFVNEALERKYVNFYAESDINENGSELFKFYLNRPKAELDNFTVNGTKGGTNSGNAVNDAYYIQAGANGKYNLRYSFTIRNEGAVTADTKYCCKLYIDVNADGKFSEQEEISDINITQNGARVSDSELYADREYVLTREVPSGYKGLLPWKVEVCQINNKNIYASATGYTKLEGMETELLKICQINRDNTGDVIDLNAEITDENSAFHILLYGGDYDKVHYEGIRDDFEISVTTLTITEFEQKYEKNKDYLKDFNMLILGFSDYYGDFSGNATSGPMGSIVEFINSGKSVLLAHDTTSFFNNMPKDGEQKGYPDRSKLKYAVQRQDTATSLYFAGSLNTYIRPLVGMDRYGVLDIAALRKGVALKESDSAWNDVVNSGKDVAYKPKSGKKETVQEVQGYTYSLISAKDHKIGVDTGDNVDYRRNAIKSYNKKEVYSKDYKDMQSTPESWSFTNTYRNIRYDKVFYGSWGSHEDANSYGELAGADNGEVGEVHVTQVNKGQITEYPYKLADDFEVAATHAQYYELDYTIDDDQDGQSDLVVWYCLGGRTSDSGQTETIYSQSPNDVRNNYYIYNKGNITYTGMGHSADRETPYTLEEAKLFVNTMIASYQAGVKPPYISVKENQYAESPEIHTMYHYFDGANGTFLSNGTTEDGSEKVYFTVQDVNFVKGIRNIMTHVYYKDSSSTETITVNGLPVPVRKLEDRIYNATTGEPADAENLQSGGMYYILVPKNVMEQCENSVLRLYFEAQSKITPNSDPLNPYITEKTYSELEVLKAHLFELD